MGWKTWLILAVLALAAWGIKVKWFSSPPAPQVITADVELGDMEDTVLASGTIEAIKQVSVGAQVSGQVKRLHVALGEQVKQGQLVAEIDATPQTNAMANAQSALAAIQAQRVAKLALRAQAELGFRRQQQLLAQDATSLEAYEAAQANLGTLKAEIAAQDAQIQQARITVDTQRLNLGYTRITAPMDGVVVAVVTEEGRTVNANQSAPTIVKIARLDTMTIKAQLSEADVVRIKPGQPVYFTILGEPRKRYEAKLRAIEPAPQSEQTESSGVTGTSSASSSAIYYNGLFDVPNPEGRLRISMTAQVSVVLAEAKHVLLIPASALGSAGKDGRYQVKLLQGQGDAAKVVSRQVSIGLNNRVQAQVLDGLKAGEKVVVGDAAGDAGGGPGKRGGPRMF